MVAEADKGPIRLSARAKTSTPRDSRS